MGLSTFLAFKYIKPKRSVASVITCVSILGVLLGVAVVIIVRSVMTGFGDVWREKILDFKPHVTIQAQDGFTLHDEGRLSDLAREVPGVTCVNPEILTRVMASRDVRVRRPDGRIETESVVQAPVLIGIAGDDFMKAYHVGEPVSGTFDLDQGEDERPHVVIGAELARMLGIVPGLANRDLLTVCAPPKPEEIFVPQVWRVVGTFSSGQHDYDSDFMIADLEAVRELVGWESGVSAICLKTDRPADERAFNALTAELDRKLNGETGAFHPYRILSWKEADRQIFNALAVETNMTAVLLLLISLVALFCVMNTLLVLTVQKTPEIGLLKALGFGKLRIMGVFLVHGLIQCTIGVVLGLLASWAVLSNLQRIVDGLARCGMEVFPAEIYKLEEIPHHIVASDVVFVVTIIYVFGLLASLVPALIAASKDPVKALNE